MVYNETQHKRDNLAPELVKNVCPSTQPSDRRHFNGGCPSAVVKKTSSINKSTNTPPIASKCDSLAMTKIQNIKNFFRKKTKQTNKLFHYSKEHQTRRRRRHNNILCF